jgi:hypothetical protein
MIGHEIGSSPVRVYTTFKTSSLKNFKHGWENDMGANMATLFARGGFSKGQASWATSNPQGRNLNSTKLQLETKKIKNIFFPHLVHMPYQLLPQITLSWVGILH